MTGRFAAALPDLLTGRLTGLLTGLLLVLAPVSAAAEERLTLPTPDGWRTLTNLVAPLLRRSEFAIPAAPVDGGDSGEDSRQESGRESGEKAQDKLSFEWFDHALAPGLDPLDLSAQLAAGVRRECRSSRDNPVFAGYENGYPTVVRLITCAQRRQSGPDGGEIGEVLMLKAIQGETGHWLIVRGRQLALAGADGGPAGDLLSPDTVRAWTEAFRAITLCDPGADAHPCPPVEADSAQAAEG